MRSHKDHFGKRLNTSADAKKTMLAKFAARPPADDPAVLEQQAARKAIAAAREARAADRKAAREAEAARLATERANEAAAQEARKAEAAAREAEEEIGRAHV